MRRTLPVTLFVLVLALGAQIPGAHAFIDEVELLRRELHLYDTANAADFSDLVDRLASLEEIAFTDVKPADSFYNDVIAMARRRIISGYVSADGKTSSFRPQEKVIGGAALKMVLTAARRCTDAELAVKTADWALPYVQCARRVGVRIAAKPGFNAKNQITRVQTVMLLVDAFGVHASAAPAAFRDVPKTAEGSAEIATAVEEGILPPRREGIFDPNGKVSRAEMAVAISRMLRLQALAEIGEQIN